MKLTKFKKTIISSALVGMCSAGAIYAAATPTKQDAFYDTFTFKVNGIVQYISDITKKPFIANSRVYVPISTLKDLGIANVEWINSNGGVSAELRITPATSQVDDKSSYYEQKFNEMATQIAQKDVKIKELEESVKKLTEENATLKKGTTTSSNGSNVPDSEDRAVKNQVSDLEYDMSKDRDFNRLEINRKTFNVDYDFNYRRGTFEVKVYVKGLSADDLKTIKDSSSAQRDIDDLISYVSRNINKQKGFENVDIYITMYDSSNGDREIADYTNKGGRLRGAITLK